MGGTLSSPSSRARLDPVDLRILAVLQADGRITKQRLAEAVNLSPSACHERVKRLERAGYIHGYHADVAIRRLGPVTEALVELTLERHQAQDFEAFEQGIQRFEEVIDCWAIGGGMDYLLRVVARDIAHYQEIVDRLLATQLGIGRYFTYFVTRSVKRARGVPLHVLLDAPE